MDIERRATGAHDVCDRDRLLRRLPFRPAHGALRMGRHDLSLRARPRDRRPRQARSAATSPASRLGELVGVGCMVGSCQHCRACDEGLEQYCEDGFVGTYNGPTPDAPGHTLGGYSQRIVVDEKFVLKIRHPEAQLAAVAPLLCAGITTYSPLRHWKVGPGKKVGIVGIGGLGHMGVKLAHAMGAHVVAFTTSRGQARGRAATSARTKWWSRANADEMKAHAGSFDFILNTVAAPHDLDAFTTLLKRDGTMCWSACPAQPHPSPERRQPDLQAPRDRRLADRRHRRDAGDARLLRRARHRRRTSR